jgi:hypothetical protein
LSLTNNPHFVISGEIIICNCEWNLTNIINNVHFELDGGMFKCDNMVVGSYEKSSLNFLNYSTANKLMYADCVKLIFKDIKTNLDNYLFYFDGGQANFTDSVYFN